MKEEKELSFSERRLLEQARNLVVTELALARNVSIAKVEKGLRRRWGLNEGVTRPPTPRAWSAWLPPRGRCAPSLESVGGLAHCVRRVLGVKA